MTVGSLTASRSCGLLVTVRLVNDNPPVVDLNGPALPSINHAATLIFHVPVNTTTIASPDVAIMDLDEDGRIEELVVNLTVGRENADDTICLRNFCGDQSSEDAWCQEEDFNTCHFR